MTRSLLYLPMALLLSYAAGAQQRDSLRETPVADTTNKNLFSLPDTVPKLHSKAWAWIPPAAMVTYGATSLWLQPLRRFDRFINDNAAEHNVVPRQSTENYLQYSPVIITYGLNLAGIHGKNRFADRTLIWLMAEGMMQLSVTGLKKATHRERPNGANKLSFPSGHTANAFLGAEFMAQEFSGKSWVYGFAGYTLATATGVFRIYHHDHWFSDVVAGAGFGILSAKGAYLLYPLLRNKRKRNTAGSGTEKIGSDTKGHHQELMLFPAIGSGATGMQFSMRF